MNAQTHHAGPPGATAGTDAHDAVREQEVQAATGVARSRRGLGVGLAYAAAVVLGLAVAVSPLLTVLLEQGWPGVAVAASVAAAAGLAASGWVAPALRRRTPALLACGVGAGLMAGAVVLAACAVLIATS